MARKNRNNDADDDSGVGMVMTCSLFLILLTFFILLNSISVLDQKKTRAAIGSLVAAFGNMGGGLSPLRSGSAMMPPSAPLAKQKLDLQKLIEAVNPIIISNQIKVLPLTDRGIITINEAVLFDKNTYDLKTTSRPLLDKIAHFINQGDYSVEIAGHTDNRPADEKGYRSNWEISSLMAIQVQKYLVGKGKVLPRRIAAYGHADHQPIASNNTRQSRRQNRRVEIILNYGRPEYVKKIFMDKPAGIFTYKRFHFKIF